MDEEGWVGGEGEKNLEPASHTRTSSFSFTRPSKGGPDDFWGEGERAILTSFNRPLGRRTYIHTSDVRPPSFDGEKPLPRRPSPRV